ncbi:MAG: GntR family transcriptional regulator [Pseudochelatococcus sp.]|uniref:GntR family transcriptional regulator n=1 Tax=Pseudochelatococcus sp. TaxID=2020869 RepID=UPI003D8DE04D
MLKQALKQADPAAADKSRTAIDAVYRQLQERILAGELEPGARLHVNDLRKDFGVGTSTVREALSRLLAGSLVISHEQRGFYVAPLSITDFRDITEARKIVEINALRLSLLARTDEWEAQLVAAYHRLQNVEQRLIGEGRKELTEEWDELNARFHDALVANCHNSWLIRFRRTLHQQSYRYNRLSLANTHQTRDVREEHRAIFEAALANDIDRLSALIDVHIETTFSIVVARLESQIDAAGSYRLSA